MHTNILVNRFWRDCLLCTYIGVYYLTILLLIFKNYFVIMYTEIFQNVFIRMFSFDCDEIMKFSYVTKKLMLWNKNIKILLNQALCCLTFFLYIIIQKNVLCSKITKIFLIIFLISYLSYVFCSCNLFLLLVWFDVNNH